MTRRAKPDLHLVEEAPQKRDIYAADKARIAATDWAKIHVRGDRSKAINLADRPRRTFGLGGW